MAAKKTQNTPKWACSGLFPTSQAWVSTERDGEVCAWSSSNASWGPESFTRTLPQNSHGLHLPPQGPKQQQAGADMPFVARIWISNGHSVWGENPTCLFDRKMVGNTMCVYYSYRCCVTNYTNFWWGLPLNSQVDSFYTVNRTLTFLEDGVSLYHFW